MRSGSSPHGSQPSMQNVHSVPALNAGIATGIARLADIILSDSDHDLAEILRTIASEIGVSHIAYLRLTPDKSTDLSLLVAVVTYLRSWQQRYFLKNYVTCDPVIAHGRNANEPYDWSNLPLEDPSAIAFFSDALNHGVGRNGLSIPLRGLRGVLGLVSFTSDVPKNEWEDYTAANLQQLKLLSVLIDSASQINFKLAAAPVRLSNREEQCLIWAARGKTYQEIATILGIAFYSVKTHLDAARDKLRCANVTHAAALAFATGMIPAQALSKDYPAKLVHGEDSSLAGRRVCERLSIERLSDNLYTA
jgi:DNA-binding CsgD family transcriptional regulator